MIQTKSIQELTVMNLKNGEVTLSQLQELYNKFGFIFECSEGKFIKIKKESKNKLIH